MSLDLYVRSDEPIKVSGTGIYIRENGQTRELKTIEEARKYFPDRHITERKYITTDVWHGNITHNLGRMADRVISEKGRSLYQLLWHPKEKYVTKDWISEVRDCYDKLQSKKDFYKPMEEENRVAENNGDSYIWGTYDNLMSFTKSLLDCVENLNFKDKHYDLIASV